MDKIASFTPHCVFGSNLAEWLPFLRHIHCHIPTPLPPGTPAPPPSPSDSVYLSSSPMPNEVKTEVFSCSGQYYSFMTKSPDAGVQAACTGSQVTYWS